MGGGEVWCEMIWSGVGAYLLLDLPPDLRLVTDDTLDSPPGTIPHLLFAIHSPDAKPLAIRCTFLSESITLCRGEVFVSHRETVDVLEKVFTGFRDRHGDCESGKEGEDRGCRGNELRLRVR